MSDSAGDDSDSTVMPDIIKKCQGDKLPRTYGAFKQTKPTLQREDDFISWRTLVHNTLKKHHLKALIDYNLPRPGRDDPNWLPWFKLSIEVGCWLLFSISAALWVKINPHGRVMLADEVYEAICEEHEIYGDMTEHE
ncbi:hypothetical protein N7466_000372 [Penicillium verhagenii]|uniref:uncharacterized protein n=1 Tax=Penicillium verhagenii TaxID=1562060 RepID=UPI0025457CC5|nr:uncharacterized protein N7466_000372 [Penicillium verhagenii]KAJ5947357.1 hypothetical protein N7466_000372 [Penicillium verhagenii]